MVNLLNLIRNIPDFPKPGIQFKDVTTLAKDGTGLRESSEMLAERFKDLKITKVAGIESRGFVFGSIIAYLLNTGFILIRKPGKLPGKSFQEEYCLEYGTDKLEMHTDATGPEDNVLIIDDLLATGGTALASAKLIEKSGAKVAGIGFIIELTGSLHGRNMLKEYKVEALLKIPVEE